MDPKAARRQRKIALRREKKQAAAAEKCVSLTLPYPALAFVLFFQLGKFPSTVMTLNARPRLRFLSRLSGES